MKFLNSLYTLIVVLILAGCSSGNDSQTSRESSQPYDSEPEEETDLYVEKYRPQFHFSQPSNWMNDPNGMVFHDGIYHLFYQYFPDSTVWGPMHWGHATSSDLLFWEHKPIALYPDSLGYIFSGSAVLDEKNTSRLGTEDNPPLVAIFTYHDPVGAENDEVDFQYQGIAYSLDNGKSWAKYENNPVLQNPGIRDFRDPKVFWHDESSKWVMSLAVLDHIEFYGSENLLEWEKLSEFGKNEGSHEGVWECPDLIKLPIEGSTQSRWVLIVSIGTGGDRGSATQYFVGNFDGKEFRNTDSRNRISWLDFGWDNYAGVTWANSPNDETIFIGWMSNWLYAQDVPTSPWRSSMTVPRKLTLFRSPAGMRVRSYPIQDFQLLRNSAIEINRTIVNQRADFSSYIQTDPTYLLDLEFLFSKIQKSGSWTLVFGNVFGDTLRVGYEDAEKRYFVDRSKSGDTSFHPEFEKPHYASRFSNNPQMGVRILLDRSSIEVFADTGEIVFTDLFFSKGPFTHLLVEAPGESILFEGMVYQLSSIWNTSAQ